MGFKLKTRTMFPALVSVLSPLTLVKNGLSYVFGLDTNELRATFDGIYLPQTEAGFIQPTSYPVVITSGHVIPYMDSDAQFGNAYSQYPLGSVSTNPLLIGKAGCTIGSTTVGQTFKIVFTSSGLTGSPITITYTAGAAETTTTIAAGLAALVNANTTLHSAVGGKPIFMQSLGAGVFNLQYDSAFGATGATPLTTATTGSTGTITLTSEVNALDFIIMQLGRGAPGHTGKNGDALYAIDFTGQDSTGTLNTHYGIMSVTATVATAGATRGTFIFSTAGNAGPIGRMAVGVGAYLFDASGALPTGGDLGAGTLNIPTVGKISIDNVNNIRRVAGQFIIEATNADGIVLSSSGGGTGVNVTPTGGGFQSGLGFFASGTQVPTTGSGIGLAGGATPVLSARNYGTATPLPLAVSATVVTPLANDGTALGTTALQWSDLFLASGGVINFSNGDVSITHAVATNGQLAFSGAASGYQFDSPVYPSSNDGATLGQATVSWSDLFLAEGGVINFDNGDVTVTQNGNSLTVAGGNLVFPGTATNDNAAAGVVGEYISSTVLVGSAVSLTNGTPTNITSISLTAGDWDVEGNICFDPAGTTTWISAHAWTSTTSAAAPTAPNNGAYTQIGAPMTTGADQFLTVGKQRISLSGTTTVYLSALAGFATSTMVGYGFIGARRVR